MENNVTGNDRLIFENSAATENNPVRGDNAASEEILRFEYTGTVENIIDGNLSGYFEIRMNVIQCITTAGAAYVAWQRWGDIIGAERFLSFALFVVGFSIFYWAGIRLLRRFFVKRVVERHSGLLSACTFVCYNEKMVATNKSTGENVTTYFYDSILEIGRKRSILYFFKGYEKQKMLPLSAFRNDGELVEFLKLVFGESALENVPTERLQLASHFDFVAKRYRRKIFRFRRAMLRNGEVAVLICAAALIVFSIAWMLNSPRHYSEQQASEPFYYEQQVSGSSEQYGGISEFLEQDGWVSVAKNYSQKTALPPVYFAFGDDGLIEVAIPKNLLGSDTFTAEEYVESWNDNDLLKESLGELLPTVRANADGTVTMTLDEAQLANQRQLWYDTPKQYLGGEIVDIVYNESFTEIIIFVDPDTLSEEGFLQRYEKMAVKFFLFVDAGMYQVLSGTSAEAWHVSISLQNAGTGELVVQEDFPREDMYDFN